MREPKIVCSERTSVRNVAVWLVLCSSCGLCQSLGPASRTGLDVVKEVDKAEYARERNLAGYTVQERYDLFRRSDTSRVAEMVVETAYVRNSGKTYDVISESGSAAGKLVLHKILQNEKQVSQREGREDILITSRNYEMSVPDLSEHELHGRKCLIVLIKPRRSSPYLLAGTIWVDTDNYHLVRVEGTPSAEPSMWTGRPTIERDYTDVDGFSVAIHAKSISKQMFLGETVLEIKYENYHLSP